MSKRAPLEIGFRIGKWTVIGNSPPKGPTIHQCQCDCGTMRQIRAATLRIGATKSCGCTRSEMTVRLHTTHGESKKTRLYVIWQAMIGRCHSKRHSSYQKYGGAGICVCDQWRSSYVAFREWSLSNGYADCKSIDRIDNTLGYFPENCRWATANEQANNKTNNVIVSAFGESKTVSQWAEDARCAVGRATVYDRILKKWNPEKAITHPLKPRPLRYVSAFGETKTLAEWARDPRAKVSRRVICSRLTKGIDPEIAITAA